MKLGKYLVGNRIGNGGMGAVYEAVDTFLKRKVAVKVLPDYLGKNNDAVRRFVLEARAFAKVHHPNAVLIYEVDRRQGICYLVMELMRGGSMQEALQAHGPLAWPEATQAVADACRGLVATHAAALVHRDIKPGNLMRSADGVVKLADFGLAKDAETQYPTLTLAGGIVGTPAFMSPEQCRSEQVDPRSDIYAMGATYYNLLTGRPPYAGELPLQVLFAHCSSPVPDPRDVIPGIPQACADIVRRAMAKEPRERYPTAAAMLADLEAALYAGARSMLGDAEVQPDSALADLAAAVSVTQVAPPAAAEFNPSAAAASRALSLGQRTLTRAPRPRWGTWIALASAATIGILVPIGIHHWGLRAMLGLADNPSSDPSSSTTQPANSLHPTTRLHPTPTSREARTMVKGFGGRFPADGVILDASEAVTSIAFSRDGSRLADGHVVIPNTGAWGARIFETNVGKPKPSFCKARTIVALCYSPTRPTLAAAGAAGVTLRDGDENWDRIPVGGSSVGPARAVAFSPDGALLAALTGGDPAHQTIRIWDTVTGRELQYIKGDALESIAFAPGGKILATGDVRGVNLWDISTWKSVRELPTPSPAAALAFSPDGHTLAVAGATGVLFFDTTTWARKPAQWNSDSHVAALAYTSDSKLLACGTADGSVKLWDTATEKEQPRTFRAHTAAVTAVAFLPNSRTLATGSTDKTLKLFDLSPGAPKPSANPSTKPTTKPSTKPAPRPS